MSDTAVWRLCARGRQGWKFDCDWHLLAPAQPPYELSANWCSQWGSESGFLDGSKQPPPTFQVTITSSTCNFKLCCFAYVTGNAIWKIPRESSALSIKRDRKQHADASEEICYSIFVFNYKSLFFRIYKHSLNKREQIQNSSQFIFVRHWLWVREELDLWTSPFV